jgi:hypothetical protein
MKLQKQPTLADTICDLRARKIKTTFFIQINGLIDWDSIEKLIEAITLRGKVLWVSPPIAVCYYLKCAFCRVGRA